MKPCRHNAVRAVVALCIGVLPLSGVALAQEAPARLPETGAAANTATTYITQLDELRALSQVQAARTKENVAGSHQLTVNDYITTLDRLRNMAPINRK
jgi:hypothetical protein